MDVAQVSHDFHCAHEWQDVRRAGVQKAGRSFEKTAFKIGCSSGMCSKIALATIRSQSASAFSICGRNSSEIGPSRRAAADVVDYLNVDLPRGWADQPARYFQRDRAVAASEIHNPKFIAFLQPDIGKDVIDQAV
jgi:hypothetical protein